MKSAIAIVIVLATTRSMVSAQPLPMLSQTIHSDRPSKWSIYVDSEELAASPRWNPQKDPLPLSVTNAITSSIAWAKSDFPHYQLFLVKSVQLNRYGPVEHGFRWYYVVKMEGVRYGLESRDDYLVTIVLFSGKVIPRIIETPPKPSNKNMEHDKQ